VCVSECVLLTIYKCNKKQTEPVGRKCNA